MRSYASGKKSHALKSFSTFLLLLFALSLKAQKITLRLKNTPLVVVFNQIERQTAYRFSFATEAMADSRPLTLEVVNEDIHTVLPKIFAGQPLRYTIDQNFILVRPAPFTNNPAVLSSSFTVSGMISNENGEAVAGATVKLRGSAMATSTDNEGRFLLDSVKENSILEITSVGYQPKELIVRSPGPFVIRLAYAVSKLDEQIIIAYGATTRRGATGTVSRVSKQEIQQQPVSNPIAALAGRVAGLQVIQGSGLPGSFYSIRLRGQNSIANGNEPLILVDGIPFPSASMNGLFGGGGGVTNSPLNNLDPAEIESIEVLKDADATAIYGSRGANGVILITTKKGAVGQTSVQLNAYTGWGKLARRMHLLKTPDYLAMRREAFANDGIVPGNANAADLLVWDTTRYTDWQKILMGETMRISDVKASVSDGNQQTQFTIGAGYHRETTVMPLEFGEEKYSGYFTVQHRTANKRLHLSVHGSFLHNNNRLPQGDISSFIALPPNAPQIYDAEGRLNWENSTWTNPFSLLLKTFQTKADNLIYNTAFTYKVLPDLEFKTTFSFNRISQDEHIRLPAASNNPAFGTAGSAGFGNNQISTLMAEPQLNFRTVLWRGNLQALAGYTIQSSRQQALYQFGSGYPNDELLHSLKAAPTITTANELYADYRYVGAFARLNFDYGSRYYFTGTLRRDGSSRYGPQNRFATFGSLGMAWIFTREDFMKGASILSHGKLKGSWGITGNDQIGDYKYFDTYSPYNYPYLGIVTFQPTQLFNPSFGWERVQKRELGLELGFNKDKVLLTTNYYHNKTTNQLVSYALPTMTGFSGVLQNLPATILNRGFEFELSANWFDKKLFKWTSSVNLTIPQNKLVAFQELSRSTYANTYIVGQSLFIARRYNYLGIDPQTGNYTFEDVNRDGKISVPDDVSAVVFTGQQYYGGLQNTLQYRQFNLSFLFQFVRQENAANYLSRFAKPGTMNNQPQFVLDRWQHPEDIAAFQKFSNSNSANNTAYTNLLSSNAAFSDASFIRLKNVEISWQVMKPDGNRSHVKECTLFVQGQNLVTITRYRGLDPETKSVFPPPYLATIGFRLTY